MARTYEEVRKQWETLWEIGPAEDMTGGYVDQKDLDRLLESPTKKTARQCMEDQINYWFEVGPMDTGFFPGLSNRDGRLEFVRQQIADNHNVRAIAIDYGFAEDGEG